MITVFELAKEILTRIDQSVSGKKIQKLAYYCQAWHVTAFNEPLIDDSFQAWEHGPVVRQLWGRHRYAVAVRARDIDTPLPDLPAHSAELIAAVVEFYRSYSGDELENMTHEELPWKSAWLQGRNTNIELTAMRRYYSGVLASHGHHPALPASSFEYVRMDDFEEMVATLSDDAPSDRLASTLRRAKFS